MATAEWWTDRAVPRRPAIVQRPINDGSAVEPQNVEGDERRERRTQRVEVGLAALVQTDNLAIEHDVAADALTGAASSGNHGSISVP